MSIVIAVGSLELIVVARLFLLVRDALVTKAAVIKLLFDDLLLFFFDQCLL